jgi:ubiquinone/menaquinone biosynthesis C-methylase UbiE
MERGKMSALFGAAQQSLPALYERWLVMPLFRPFAERTLDLIGVQRGERVLDVACGTGVVARVAKERLGADGHVVGVDLSPNMLAIARTAAPETDWREGNAAALPIGDGESFDVVVCQQGLQFMQDKLAAVREMKRASAPGGRVAISTWRAVRDIPFMQDLERIAERHLGPIHDARHSFGDPAELERLVQDAGFQDVQIKQLSHTVRFDDRLIFPRLNAMALIGMSPNSKAIADDERRRIADAIVADSVAVLEPYGDGFGLAFELTTNLAIARA